MKPAFISVHLYIHQKMCKYENNQDEKKMKTSHIFNVILECKRKEMKMAENFENK